LGCSCFSTIEMPKRKKKKREVKEKGRWEEKLIWRLLSKKHNDCYEWGLNCFFSVRVLSLQFYTLMAQMLRKCLWIVRWSSQNISKLRH
jgi:hypothetical protein